MKKKETEKEDEEKKREKAEIKQRVRELRFFYFGKYLRIVEVTRFLFSRMNFKRKCTSGVPMRAFPNNVKIVCWRLMGNMKSVPFWGLLLIVKVSPLAWSESAKNNTRRKRHFMTAYDDLPSHIWLGSLALNSNSLAFDFVSWRLFVTQTNECRPWIQLWTFDLTS